MRKNRVLILGGSLLALVGCVLRESDPRLVSFSTGQAECGAGCEAVEIRVEPGALDFTGNFQAPTPCYKLHAVLQHLASPCQLVLSIVSQPVPDPCIECMALIPYEGRSEGLGQGTWRMRVYHDERLAFQGDLQVPGPA